MTRLRDGRGKARRDIVLMGPPVTTSTLDSTTSPFCTNFVHRDEPSEAVKAVVELVELVEVITTLGCSSKYVPPSRFD